MQFYILDKDPIKSAELLPDYALEKVNLREGWQIISDIGHIYGVTWGTQNKLYSASHSLTRYFACSKDNFWELIENYIACLYEYKYRFGMETIYHINYYKYSNYIYKNILEKIVGDKYKDCSNYLLKYKSKYLSDKEIERMKDIINGK